MRRREFIRQSAAFAIAPAVLSRNHAYAEEFAQKRPRVGLIGTGWYGKSDLLRLIQVAPGEVGSRGGGGPCGGGEARARGAG